MVIQFLLGTLPYLKHINYLFVLSSFLAFHTWVIMSCVIQPQRNCIFSIHGTFVFKAIGHKHMHKAIGLLHFQGHRPCRFTRPSANHTRPSANHTRPSANYTRPSATNRFQGHRPMSSFNVLSYASVNCVCNICS